MFSFYFSWKIHLFFIGIKDIDFPHVFLELGYFSYFIFFYILKRRHINLECLSYQIFLLSMFIVYLYCETPRKSNFLKKGKIVISVKIQKFSRSRMTKRTSLLESSREI